MVYLLNKLTSGHAVEFRSCCEYAEDAEDTSEDNLVPRSLVDEAEGEIWQSKKICFS